MTITQYSAATRFWILILLFFLGLIIFSLIGALAAIPFAEINSIADLNKLSDFSNDKVVLGLKISQIVSAIGTFIIPAWLFAKFSSNNKLEFLSLKIIPSWRMIFLGISIIIFAQPLINITAELNQQMHLPDFLSGLENWMKDSEKQAEEITKAFLKTKGIGDLVLNIIVIALLAAVAEELFFRGSMQKLMIEWGGNKHIGIWITAAIFSAVHMQFYGFLPRMLMGAFLGYLLEWSGSLILPIIVHFVNNGLSVMIYYFIQQGKIKEEAETIGTGNEMLTYGIMSILLVAIGIWQIMKLQEKKNY